MLPNLKLNHRLTLNSLAGTSVAVLGLTTGLRQLLREEGVEFRMQSITKVIEELVVRYSAGEHTPALAREYEISRRILNERQGFMKVE